ncbi:hypothetical protein Bpfe_020542 [Biomphalaria pfeifferi]|uniref:Uncharacterized protein n=1 Tax=Biomphalaria pfeifferi TaxID=112525 RepID=A0AAD8B8M7_BIOPF|nr:hypothetical protein Bpfe_020542 [Biomphalaria pfeifferi]
MSKYWIQCIALIVLLLPFHFVEAEGNGQEPSTTLLNFLSAMSGKYLYTEQMIGNQSYSRPSSLILRPVSVPMFNRTGTLYAEEFLSNVTVRRSLMVSEVNRKNNTIFTYPFNFTEQVSNLNGSFNFSILDHLLSSDLVYSHVCDRVVAPRSNKRAVFDFISWPFCTATLDRPPIYTAVLTCKSITVTMHDVSVVSSIPESQKVKFILHKSESFPLPTSMLGNRQQYENPCL